VEAKGDKLLKNSLSIISLLYKSIITFKYKNFSRKIN